MRIGYRRGDALVRSMTLRRAKVAAFSTRARNSRTKTSNSRSNSLTNSNRTGTSSKTNSATNRLLALLNGEKDSTKVNTAELSVTTKKSYYSGIDKYADTLQKHVSNLLDTEEEALFPIAESAKEALEALKKSETVPTEEQLAEAQEKNDTARKNILNEVTGFIDAYNSMVTNMNSLGDNMNQIHLKQLNVYVMNNKNSLKNIGITQNTDGTLKVNQTKLKGAELKDIKEVFGTKIGFADKVSGRSEYIESNAEKNISKIADSTTYASSTYSKNATTADVANSSYSANA